MHGAYQKTCYRLTQCIINIEYPTTLFQKHNDFVFIDKYDFSGMCLSHSRK